MLKPDAKKLNFIQKCTETVFEILDVLPRGKSVVAGDADQVAGVVEGEDADVAGAAYLKAVDAAI